MFMQPQAGGFIVHDDHTSLNDSKGTSVVKGDKRVVKEGYSWIFVKWYVT